MSGHHDHSGSSIWTKINSIFEFEARFFGGSYWLAVLFDILTGARATSALSISWAGLGFGIAAGLFCSAGSAYVHFILNSSNEDHDNAKQSKPKKNPIVIALQKIHVLKSDESAADESSILENGVGVPSRAVVIPIPEDHSSAADIPTLVNPPFSASVADLTRPEPVATRIKNWQYALWAGDFVMHVGDYATTLSFVASLAGGDKLPRWGKGLTNGAFLLYGIFSAIGDTRRCKNSLKKQNSSSENFADKKTGNESDKWTKFGSLSEFITTFISDCYWIATLVDLVFRFAPSVLQISWYGFAIGILIGVLTAAGSAYAHFILNRNDQTVADLKMPPANQDILGVKENIALVGDFISHVSEIAMPNVFAITLLLKTDPGHSSLIWINLASIILGAIGAVAPVITCKNNFRKAAHNQAFFKNSSRHSETENSSYLGKIREFIPAVGCCK